MNNLTPKKRIFGLPPSLILIFFFLPWITVSCSGQSSSASGYQLAVEGSGVPGDVRIPILAIGIAAVVALGVAVATNPLSRRFYTGAGLVAGASYLYLLLRFGAFAEEARRQGGTLTLELAVWGVGLAIMSIIGLGALYRPDESKLVSPDPNKAATADSRAQQAQQEKMVQYAIFAVLAVVGGVFLLSLFQSIGADLERRQVISNATATYVVATQQVQSTATANAEFRTRVRVFELDKEPQNTILYAVFSADNTRLVTSFHHVDVTVWDTTTGERLYVFREFNQAQYIAISPDVTRIVAGGNPSDGGDYAAYLWDANTGQRLAAFEGYTVFSPDGIRILSASRSEFRLYSAANGELLREFSADKYEDIRSIGFSPDGKRFWVSYSYSPSFGINHRIEIWDTESETLLHVLELPSWEKGVVFSPDGQYIAAISKDNPVIVWSIANGEQIASFPPLNAESGDQQIVFSPDSNRLAYRSGNRAWLYDITNAGAINDNIALPYHGRYGLARVAFSPDGSLLLAGNTVYDAHTGDIVRTFSMNYPAVENYGRQLNFRTDTPALSAFSADGSYVFGQSYCVGFGPMFIADRNTGESLFSVPCGQDHYPKVFFSHDASRVLIESKIGYSEYRLELYDFSPVLGESQPNVPVPVSFLPTLTPTPAPTLTLTPSPTLTHTPAPTRTPTQTRTPATPTATLAEADVIATGVAATVAALQAPTQTPAPVIDHTLNCSQSVASLGLRNGASVVAVCAQNCAQSGGTVWGTDIYTHDSSICRAALHSGIPSNQPFRVEVLPGQSSYRGSTRNSIQTSNYGSWSLSFRVTVIE